MRTLIVQDLAAVALLVLGIASWLAARSIREPSRHRQSWHVAGVVLSAYAMIYTIQVCFATAAYFGGPETLLYQSYLVAAPAGNHARTLLLFLLYGALGVVALRREGEFDQRILIAAIPVVALAGAVLGMYEGRLDPARHFSMTAVLDTVGILLLGPVLILAIHRDSMDRLLWLSMGLLGFSIIVGVIYHTGLAWYSVPGSWAPRPLHMHVMRLIVFSLQAAVAIERLRRARGGIPVSGLISFDSKNVRNTFA